MYKYTYTWVVGVGLQAKWETTLLVGKSQGHHPLYETLPTNILLAS